LLNGIGRRKGFVGGQLVPGRLEGGREGGRGEEREKGREGGKGEMFQEINEVCRKCQNGGEYTIKSATVEW
jgi:hypothetical protein